MPPTVTTTNRTTRPAVNRTTPAPRTTTPTTAATAARDSVRGSTYEAGSRHLSPAAEFGNTLWTNCPGGIAVAVYDTGDPEFGARAKEWAAGMNAVGPKAKTIAAGELALGKAIPASKGLAGLLGDLQGAVNASVDKAKRPDGVDASAAGPKQVKTLALFMHGTPSWLGMDASTSKDDLQASSVGATIKGISSFLAGDVNVVLYACGVARGESEKQDWYAGTMHGGGADSMAGAIRDALVDEGKDKATVFGHTTSGHTTRNFAIRGFEAADGKGARGHSFVAQHVWSWWELGPAEVLAEIASRGHAVPDARRAKIEGAVRASVRMSLYAVNSSANSTKTYQGKNLAEMAPVHPKEVGAIVREMWLKKWNDAADPKGKAALASSMIKAHGLKKSA